MSWNWREPDGQFGYQLFPFIHEMFTSDARDVWESGEMLDEASADPLVRRDGESASQSIGRVPVAISGPHDRACRPSTCCEPFECEQQMSIPYELDGIKHRAFVLARSRDDFTAEDIEVACRLQPLIRALSVQTRDPRLVAISSHRSIRQQRSLGLTGREIAVLQLLAEGYTAYGISRRLANSPRTVQKHLEHIYRKLAVSDRLSAVQMAVEVGIVDTDRRPRTTSRQRIGSAGTLQRGRRQWDMRKHHHLSSRVDGACGDPDGTRTRGLRRDRATR